MTRQEHGQADLGWFQRKGTPQREWFTHELPEDNETQFPQLPFSSRKFSVCTDRSCDGGTLARRNSTEFFDLSTPRRPEAPSTRHKVPTSPAQSPLAQKADVLCAGGQNQRDLMEQLAVNDAKVVNLEEQLFETRRRAATAEQERDVYLKLLASMVGEQGSANVLNHHDLFLRQQQPETCVPLLPELARVLC